MKDPHTEISPAGAELGVVPYGGSVTWAARCRAAQMVAVRRVVAQRVTARAGPRGLAAYGDGDRSASRAADGGEDTSMSVDRGLLALLEAKPGKSDELAAFLQQGRELAVAEEGTVTWYAFKISDTTYGIFDTFEGEQGRQAHLNGQIPAALGQVGPDLLAADPDIRTVDVLAVK